MNKQIAALLAIALLSLLIGCGGKSAESDAFPNNSIESAQTPSGSQETASTSIPAHEHNYIGSVVQEPTCEKEGMKVYICDVCEMMYTEVIEKTEHDWATRDADGSVYCTVCGTVQ